MRISAVKVKKDRESKVALDQGFAINFFECSENEIVLMLPTDAETLKKSIDYHGWKALGEVITSH